MKFGKQTLKWPLIHSIVLVTCRTLWSLSNCRGGVAAPASPLVHGLWPIIRWKIFKYIPPPTKLKSPWAVNGDPSTDKWRLSIGWPIKIKATVNLTIGNTHKLLFRVRRHASTSTSTSRFRFRSGSSGRWWWSGRRGHMQIHWKARKLWVRSSSSYSPSSAAATAPWWSIWPNSPDPKLWTLDSSNYSVRVPGQWSTIINGSTMCRLLWPLLVRVCWKCPGLVLIW